MSQSTSAPKRIVLVGHCGPDSSYLRMTIGRAIKGASVLMADDQANLDRLISEGADLLMVNRVLDYGFNVELGTELIQMIRRAHPAMRLMLITNYPDVQAKAISLGALPGFGKAEMGSPKAAELLRNALSAAVV